MAQPNNRMTSIDQYDTYILVQLCILSTNKSFYVGSFKDPFIVLKSKGTTLLGHSSNHLKPLLAAFFFAKPPQNKSGRFLEGFC